MRARERALGAVADLARSGPHLRELLRGTLDALRPALGFDAVCITSVDPVTLLPTSAVTENLPRDSAPAYFRNELSEEDFNKFEELFARGIRARTLHDATSGDASRSRRWREQLVPLGLGPELRAVLLHGGECWGAVGFLRSARSTEFAADDVALLARASEHLGFGIRSACILRAHARGQLDGPGVVVADADGRILSTTEAADTLLDLVDDGDHGAGRDRVPVALEAVLASAGRAGAAPSARVRGRDGSWISIHAAPLRSEGSAQQRAIVIDRASPRELAAVIVRAYALSPRERQVAELVLRGLSNKEIAQALELSTHTVGDHLKALFEKVNVHSRGELAGRFFFDHHLPRIAAGADVGASGWFLEPMQQPP